MTETAACYAAPVLPVMRILDSRYIQGTKEVMHRVQLSFGSGVEPVIKWMTTEDRNHWWRQLYGYTVEDGVVRRWPSDSGEGV